MPEPSQPMSAMEYQAVRDELNRLHSILEAAPTECKMGWRIFPGGLLNAYREGDVSFDKAVEQINEIIAQSRAEDAKTIAELRERTDRFEKFCIDRGLWEKSPCCICGYNGPGYFQGDTHRCAAIAQGITWAS